MRIPQRRKREKMGVRVSAVIRCPSHLAHIRRLECAVKDRALTNGHGITHVCGGPIEAAHVRTGTDGAMGMKPSDSWSLPLCQDSHRQQHQIGEAMFEVMYRIDMKAIAAELWKHSPAGIKYRKQQERTK